VEARLKLLRVVNEPELFTCKTKHFANPCCKLVVTAPPSEATVICSLASIVKKVALAALVTFAMPPLPI
jgi:hypothetical protein